MDMLFLNNKMKQQHIAHKGSWEPVPPPRATILSQFIFLPLSILYYITDIPEFRFSLVEGWLLQQKLR